MSTPTPAKDEAIFEQQPPLRPLADDERARLFASTGSRCPRHDRPERDPAPGARALPLGPGHVDRADEHPS